VVLEIVAKRKNFVGDLAKLKSLCSAARSESEHLARYSEDDIAAYSEYLKSRQATRKLIEAPLQAARSALLGLDLCVDAAGMVRGAVAADLGTAAILLEAAVRAILLNVDANLQQLPDHEAMAERKELEAKACQRLDAILRQVATSQR
jgi:formiminotetrahydrofolate cyclodeaminase